MTNDHRQHRSGTDLVRQGRVYDLDSDATANLVRFAIPSAAVFMVAEVRRRIVDGITSGAWLLGSALVGFIVGCVVKGVVF